LRLLAAAALVALVVLTGGCGAEGVPDEGNVSRGKQLFSSAEGRCSACHALADAGSTATVGPNLDHAFARPRQEGFEESTIRALVFDQILYPTEGSGMPAKLVTGDDAEAVAAYVASVAGDPEIMRRAAEGGGTGEQIFEARCQSCHSLDGARGTGPPLNGLKKPDAYILESILDPDAKIAPGYTRGVMSAAVPKGSVSEADAKKLVDFIKSQK
jgi:mono/diheme cytochrome c family protein